MIGLLWAWLKKLKRIVSRYDNDLLRAHSRINELERIMHDRTDIGRCAPPMKPKDLWERDDIQFPRLLCEIVATQDIDMDALEENMDLNSERLEELFDRAHDAWEKAKAETFADADQNADQAAPSKPTLPNS